MRASLVRTLWCTAALLAAFLVVATTAVATPVEIDLIYPESVKTSFGGAAENFRRLVESRSRGEIQVVPHADGRWGGRTLEDPEMITEVRAGRIRMALVPTAHLSNLSPALEVLNAPFLFKSYDHVRRVLDGPIGKRLLESSASRGVRGLAFVDGGFRLFACTRPVARLSDFQGLRVRTLQNRTYVSLVKALGGVPVPAAMFKIRAMVERGFIDAADRSYPSYGSLELYDLLRYVTETNHAYVAKVFIVNEPFFGSLSPGQRAIVDQAARESAVRQRAAFAKEIDAVKKHAVSRGVRIIPLGAAERVALETAVRVVQEEVTRLAGVELVEQVRAADRH